MADTQPKRLSKIARELNVGISTIVDFLSGKGVEIDANPNTKIEKEAYQLLLNEFQAEKTDKEKSRQMKIVREKRETISIDPDEPAPAPKEKEQEGKEFLIKNVHPVEEEIFQRDKSDSQNVKVVGKIDLDNVGKGKKEKVKEEKAEPAKPAEEPAKQDPVAEEKPAEKPAEKQAEKPKEEEEEKAKPAPEKEQPVAEKAPEAEKPETKTPEPEAKKDTPKEETKETQAKDTPAPAPSDKNELFKTRVDKLEGPTILGKIDLPARDEKKKPVASSSPIEGEKVKRKRKRIRKGPGGDAPQQSGPRPAGGGGGGQGGPGRDRRGPGGPPGRKPPAKVELTEEEIQNQIKETLARLSGQGKSKASKYRKQKREAVSERLEEERERQEAEKKILKVTEFITANQLASLMNVSVTDIISTCMALGLFVSINQRLDAETIKIVSEEFGYQVEFVTVEAQEAIETEVDSPENLLPRSPIVTVMGHVDHGKTSLLDYVRKANVIAGEAGGITQHIGAYNVQLEDGKSITFLDTPGHEAFTAMRARGAKVTDVAIVVVAADDNVMPQTVEAINHAQAAGVPIVFAINKVDKPNANPNKIKEELANMNILVEEWGGKYQSQDISAKTGANVNDLLEKVLLEAELLDVKANPNKPASGTVIESALDKGRGYICTMLVQAGTLRIGDYVLAGPYSGKVKALFNERNQPVDSAGPAMPALILGLDGAPQAGDRFNVMQDEREAKQIAVKRQQLLREQGMRTQKHITLDEIGRRLAIGDFRELNIIVKGDVDGSIEALSDSLLKLSTEKIQVNIIHKSVGQITESDVLLASASDAIIIGFQVRPSPSARKLAEAEQIDIRLYSIIYNAINEIKAAMEGMLAPEFEEKITANVEVRETFKISKVGTIAGCMVIDGKLNRNNKIRIIRDGIVVYSGELSTLKRFKDDVKEVATGYECGLSIANFNDLKVGDIIEGYEMVEVKAKL